MSTLLERAADWQREAADSSARARRPWDGVRGSTRFWQALAAADYSKARSLYELATDPTCCECGGWRSEAGPTCPARGDSRPCTY